MQGANIDERFECFMKRHNISKPCGHPEDWEQKHLKAEKPCMEGFTVGRGGPCTVMCEEPKTHRPWPKVTTCMSNGQLEDA